MTYGETRFWYLFGGIWLLVGSVFAIVGLALIVAQGPDLSDPLLMWLFVLIGLVASFAGVIVILRARGIAARDRRIRETGIRIAATVTDVRQSAFRVNGRPLWHVFYKYEYSRGKAFEGKTRAMSAEDAQAYKAGERIAIRVDPSDPGASVVAG